MPKVLFGNFTRNGVSLIQPTPMALGQTKAVHGVFYASLMTAYVLQKKSIIIK